MRDRLIGIITELLQSNEKVSVEMIADELLFEGVIVPPCKVGQWVYVPWRWEGQQAIAMVKVEEIVFYDSSMHYMFLIDMESDDESFNQSFGGWKVEDAIGTTVFLTREEAEQALKGAENPCHDCPRANIEFVNDNEYGCFIPCSKAKAFWKAIDNRLDRLLEKVKTVLTESEKDDG